MSTFKCVIFKSVSFPSHPMTPLLPTTYNLPQHNIYPPLRCLNAGAKQIMVSKAISNFALHRFHRMHLVFGANTDVGKSIVSVCTYDVFSITYNFAFLIGAVVFVLTSYLAGWISTCSRSFGDKYSELYKASPMRRFRRIICSAI